MLTGYNAAGKSTSIQPLLLLAQASRRGGKVQNLDLNGVLVRLGTAGEVLAADASQRSIRFGFESDGPTFQWTFKVTEAAGAHALETVGLSTFRGGAEAEILSGNVWSETPHPELTDIRDQIGNAVYLGTARAGAAEVYPVPDNAVVHADVGVTGEYAPWWYAQYGDEDVEEARRHPDETGITLRRQLDAYLSELFPGGQTNAELVPRTQLTRLTFRSSTRSDWLRPANIGYGLSYAFPVLVALLLAKVGQIIVIDSPEAHLHPRGQSQMGRLLARIAAAGVQVIVETHSDHLLNGARLAVREGLLPAKDIALQFFRGRIPGSPDTGVISPRVDRNGALDVWPEGFFDQAEHDLSTLSGLSG
jgi:predicted ATPase